VCQKTVLFLLYSIVKEYLVDLQLSVNSTELVQEAAGKGARGKGAYEDT
jgi:hypothetical protein